MDGAFVAGSELRSLPVRLFSGLIRLIRAALFPGLALVAAALLVVAVPCYLWRWDRAAAITVFPFWIWCLAACGGALVSWLVSRRRCALVVALAGAVTMLAGSDEVRPLLRSRHHRPSPGPPAAPEDGARILRVVTFNCRTGRFNPRSVDDLIPWQPDVVLLQETVTRPVLESLAATLYGGRGKGAVAAGRDCSIVARGRILARDDADPPHGLVATIERPDGRRIQAVSVHLSGAETNLRLYDRQAFAGHAENRRQHRRELQEILAVCEARAIRGPAGGAASPCVIGGDFNAPAGDAIFRLLRQAGLRDAFADAGSGWGNTYPNPLPVLRIDHQWVSEGLEPVRAAAVNSSRSDHRFVICDYRFR